MWIEWRYILIVESLRKLRLFIVPKTCLRPKTVQVNKINIKEEKNVEKEVNNESTNIWIRTSF